MNEWAAVWSTSTWVKAKPEVSWIESSLYFLTSLLVFRSLASISLRTMLRTINWIKLSVVRFYWRLAIFGWLFSFWRNIKHSCPLTSAFICKKVHRWLQPGLYIGHPVPSFPSLKCKSIGSFSIHGQVKSVCFVVFFLPINLQIYFFYICVA